MNRIDRRSWLTVSGAGLALAAWLPRANASDPTPVAASRRAQQPDPERLTAHKRELVRKLLYARADIDDWLTGKAYPFSKYDAELGYLHIDRDFKEGVDGAVCRYRYDPSGARHMSACAERPCRINTYGDSFTSCEQVSDHETWQEVLAAHLGEPVRNYGIGGYSVYQAYLRMRREETRSHARYIIFNIFDDDHFRNLHGWQRPRFGINRKAPNPPVPYVKVDAEAGTFEERPNPCPTPESLYRLCELESALSLVEDDYSIGRIARRSVLREQGVADVPASDFDDAEYTRQGLYATTRVVELVEKFAAEQDRRVLYVLSYGSDRIRRFIDSGQRFDKPLVDFLEAHKLPFVELLAAHAREYRTWGGGDLNGYFARYYIGHYNPRGNFFCAFAMKDAVVSMLDPPPPAYQSVAEP